MPYIGTSPSQGVRRVHTYTATANQTSFSGAGAEGATLSYKDSNFVDVYQNGVKLGDADYTATSGTAIVLGTGATVSDLVVIVAYDVFSAADTVSKADGGQFDGNVTMAGTLAVTGTTALTGNATMAGTLGVTGAVTANAGVVVDNITIDGTEIDLSSGDLTLDVAGDIVLDADGGDIILKDGGTQFGTIVAESGGLGISSAIVQDSDIIFKGNDGGSTITALTLDMSEAGRASFSSHVILGDNSKAIFGAASDLNIYHDGSNSYIQDTGTGQLRIDTNGTDVRITKTNSEYMATFNVDAAVELYHNNSKKFETTSTGVNITGHVTKPNLPSFHASGIANTQSSGATSNANEVITFTNVNLNNGSHFNNSNGRFTAPIAGIYYFSQSFLYDDNGSSQGSLLWRKNGSNINGSAAYIVGSQFSSYVQSSSAFIISLSASDYVELYAYVAGWHTGNESTACGYLIG